MASLKEILGRKLGPLPVGVWLLAVGGGLALSYGMSRDGGEDDADAELSDDELIGVSPDALAGFSTPIGPVVNPVQTAPPPASGEPVDNDAWARLAADRILARDPALSALDVSRALQRYINGQTLTPQQVAIVNQAINLIGQPPEPVPEPPDEVPQAPPPTQQPSEPKPPKPPKGPAGPVWGAGISKPEREALAAAHITPVMVADALRHLKLATGGTQIDMTKDIRRGLKKLGWKDIKTPNPGETVKWTRRLVLLQRPSKK